MNNKSHITNAIFALGVAGSLNLASAQTLINFKASTDRVAVNTPVTALVEFKEADRNWCGFYIDWGDGKEPQSFRIGRKPDLASPVSRQRSFDKPGTYTLKAYGDFVSKGLQSAEKCKGTLQPITITVYDPTEDDAKKVQEARIRELERQLNEAQAESAKTSEQKAEEARIAVEARASTEAKVAAEAKAAAEKKALDEARVSAEAKAAAEARAAEKARAVAEERAAARAEKASDVGVCSGALQMEFQKGDRATAMKFYNQKKADIDMHDSRIAKACPKGINESCFNTLPLDTRIYMESRHNAIKDLNSAGNTNLLNKPLRGNDPMTRGIVLMGFCS